MTKQFKTAQEACDYSVQQIVAQGEQCYNKARGRCLHSDGQGNHCAIGWFLDPDNEVLMNYVQGVRDVVEDFPDNVPEVIKDNIDLFSELQRFHDQPNSIIREMCRDGLRYNYKIDTSAPHWQQWIDMGERR